MRVRRAASAVALAALVSTGVTACQTHVGLAASVGSVTLSDTALARLVRPGAAPYTDQSSGDTIYPKVNALTTWVRVQAFDAAIAQHGGARKPAEASAARTALLATSDLAGARKAEFKQGYASSYSDLEVDEFVNLIVLIQRLVPGTSAVTALTALQQGSADSRIIAATNAVAPRISISGRYGTWKPAALAVSSAATAGLPTFVHLGSSG